MNYLESLEQNEMCRIAAGLAKGSKKALYSKYAKQHLKNAIAEIDFIYGAPSDDILNMSNEELLKSLEE